mgnify:CR=1 FL=1
MVFETEKFTKIQNRYVQSMIAKPNIVKDIMHAVQRVVGQGQVSLHEPSFNGNELKYLKACLDTTFVSSVGRFVDQFENDLAEFTGAKHVISVVNGTSALHIALKLSGVKELDEVLVPSLTFVATANAVTYCNATPHFVEVEPLTFGIDAQKLRDYLIKNTKKISGKSVNVSTGRVIRAMVVMHTFGHPSDLESLIKIARDFDITLVEDAAEALGSFYKKRHVGTFGHFGVLSFNGNKTITTGAGGAILTNDEKLFREAKHITTTAKVPHRWEYCHDQVGYNYRMANINAALGCAQLEQLAENLSKKRSLYLKYFEAFKNVAGVKLISEPHECKSNYWLQTLLLDTGQAKFRDEILKATNDAGQMTRPSWQLMSELVQFLDCPRMDLDVSKALSRRLINIPSSSKLMDDNF